MAGETQRDARIAAFYRKYPELGKGKRRDYLERLMLHLLKGKDKRQRVLEKLCGVSQKGVRDVLNALRGRGFVTENGKPVELTKAGVEALNELTLDVVAMFKTLEKGQAELE